MFLHVIAQNCVRFLVNCAIILVIVHVYANILV